MNSVNVLEIVKTTIWPVVVLVLGLSYLFGRGRVVIKLPGGAEIHLSSEQAAKKLSELFIEFHKVYDSLLKENQKTFFRQLLVHGGTPSVKEMIPDFNHDNKEQIGMLRALRGLGLIAPAEGGSWKEESHISITKFGIALTSYMTDKL